MSETVEIRTELALVGIEMIRNELRAVSARFGDVDKSRDVAQKGFGDWIQKAHGLSAVLGTNLSDIAAKVKGLGEEFVGAGKAAEAGDVALATMIKTTQGGGLDSAIEKAQGVGDALDEMAVRVGINSNQLGAAFQLISERTGSTNEGLAEGMARLQDMAQISSKLGKNVEAVAGEYAFMAEGQLRTRGQLFQLLQTTGIFGKDVRKASEYWASLTEQSRVEQLRYGLSKIGDQIADMPTYFSDASDAFDSMVQAAKEKVGEPIVKELTPALQEVAQQLYDLAPDLEDFGRMIAKEVGQGVRDGGKMIREALTWLRDHKTEIADDLRAAADAIRTAVKFVIDNREVIALAMGAKTAAPLLKGGAGVVSGIAKAGASGGLDAFSLGATGPGLSGAAGAAGSLGLLAAAIAALGAVAYAEYELINGLVEESDRARDAQRRLHEEAMKGNVEFVENTANTMREIQGAAGDLNPELERFYRTTIETARAVRAGADASEQTLRTAIGRSQNILRDVAAAAAANGIEAQQQVANTTAVLANAYNLAVVQGNTAMATLAAQTIAGNEQVKAAFLQSAQDVEGGFANMADLLLQGGGQFAGFAAQLRGKGATPPPPKIVMNGGQTFNVKQDFRNQDPDRVAIVMRKDLARAVERRTGGRGAGAFGY